MKHQPSGLNRDLERVQAVLSIGDAVAVKHQGLERDTLKDAVLSILTLAFEAGEDGTGRMVLTFAGDGAIAIDVESINVTLQDVTRPYRAPSQRAPGTPGMIFRRLTENDAGIFRDLRLLALKDSPENFASTYEDWKARSLVEYREIIRTEAVFAVFEGDRPLGLAGLVDEDRSKMAHRTTLSLVFVRPECRGSEAAEVLLNGVIAKARASGRLQIEAAVNSENLRAIRFYERHSFRIVGKIPRGFAHEGRFIDEVLMVLLLDGSPKPA